MALIFLIKKEKENIKTLKDVVTNKGSFAYGFIYFLQLL